MWPRRSRAIRSSRATSSRTPSPAIRRRFGYRGEGGLEAGSGGSFVNASRNALRDRPPPALPLHEVASEPAATNGRAGGEVRALLALLPERQRLVLFLRHYADLDYRQIADALEIQPSAPP